MLLPNPPVFGNDLCPRSSATAPRCGNSRIQEPSDFLWILWNERHHYRFSRFLLFFLKSFGWNFMYLPFATTFYLSSFRCRLGCSWIFPSAWRWRWICRLRIAGLAIRANIYPICPHLKHFTRCTRSVRTWSTSHDAYSCYNFFVYIQFYLIFDILLLNSCWLWQYWATAHSLDPIPFPLQYLQLDNPVPHNSHYNLPNYHLPPRHVLVLMTHKHQFPEIDVVAAHISGLLWDNQCNRRLKHTKGYNSLRHWAKISVISMLN